ncbi:MAG: hypothetical protein AAGD00_08250 [Planctomycetota bacterium]
MDDQPRNPDQGRLEVGAGLQESRLNTDLIDWLNKWGVYILSGVLVIALIYVGSVQLEQAKEDRLDEAFTGHSAARGERGRDTVLMGSPDTLLALAEDSKGQGSVSLIARLDAADIYLGSARRGLRPGADITNPQPEDELTDDQIESMLAQAGEQYQRVLDTTGSSTDHAVVRLHALEGLASTLLSRSNIGDAEATLTEAAELAESVGLTKRALAIRNRIERAESVAMNVTLYSENDLMREYRRATDTVLPADPPAAGAAPPTIITGGDGSPIQLRPVERPDDAPLADPRDPENQPMPDPMDEPIDP